MILGLSRVFIPLSVKTISITRQNTVYITVTNKLYAKSSFFLHVMSYSSNGRKKDMETEGKEISEKDLIKSENDPMEYRLLSELLKKTEKLIKLDNGLRAILVSDATKLINLNALGSATDESDESDDEKEDEEDEEENESDNNVFEEETNNVYSEDEDTKSKPSVREAEEKMAACALCIGVGSFSDPPDIPGLAHFLEHMVFMGSSKYPQENGFDEFIKKHGGSDNGSTECETTTFYLECNDKYLKEGMDRFAQFFISPLMKREAMTREREIIHSEFEMTLPSDMSRREQILGSFAPPGHPAAKFLWGNLTTLRDTVNDNDLYNRVHEFRKRHYSAHRMTVAVQARLSLDTLESYVRSSFSDIPTNNLPPDNFYDFIDAFGTSDSFNKIVWVKPVKDICQVHLTWVLPSFLKEYMSMPLDYVAWLIGHEGEGSLLSLLRKKVWALDSTAGNDESGFEHNSIYSLFLISLTLTEEGYKNIEKVISLVFSYISMLRKNCPNKKIYDELQKIFETNFRYKTEIPSANYVEILAESMHFYKPEHYIAGGELYLQYKPELITKILNLLTPDRVNISLYSKENSDSFYDKIEPWFGTKHKIEDIPEEWKKMWKNCPLREEFHIPDPNPYLTTDFSILEAPATNPPYPRKILDTPLIELWYRQDVKFKEPLAYFSFYIVSTVMQSDPLNVVLLDMLSTYLETKLKEKIFPANEAGLYCTFFPIDLGLLLHFSGYNEKLPLLFDEILKLVKSSCEDIKSTTNTKLFKAIKKGKSRSYYNRFLKPRKLVKMARLSLLVEHSSRSVESFNLLNQVTLEKLHEFAETFWSSVRIFGLIQGNVSEEKSLKLCEKFQTVLQCSPLEGEKPSIRVMKLQPGEVFLRVKSFNKGDSNSVVVNYYQYGRGNIRTSCIIDLLMMIMDEPLFDNLRTKQQIGYDVHCLLRDTFGILGFSVTVFFQATKFNPDEVDVRIEEFLKLFLKTLKSMPKDDWEEIKKSLILLKSSADLQLEDEVKRNFSEISSGEYQFDRLQKEIEIIPDITHKELCKWFADHIASGKYFRKLSVQIVGSNKENETSEEDEPEVSETFQLETMKGSGEKENLFITDIVKFKENREFYPVIKKS